MVNWLGFCLIVSTIFMLSVLTNGSIITQRAPYVALRRNRDYCPMGGGNLSISSITLDLSPPGFNNQATFRFRYFTPQTQKRVRGSTSSFHTNNPDNKKFFFFDIEFQESQASFALFSVKSLPHICLVPPFAIDFERDSIQMESSDISRHAESMAEFVEAKSEHTVGTIHRPGFISKKQRMCIIALGLILSPFLVKKIVSGNSLLHDKNIWMAGSIFVYFFSVSGTMYNIINKIPIAMVDRDDPGKLVFFYDGSGMQLGAEGFTVGFLYTIFGLMLAFVTHVLIHVKNRNIQRFVMLLAIFVSFWAVKKVFYLYNWKTGLGPIYG
ncbi:hypothetical protein MTR67_042399 [Solanum verrucosum]|uniref:Dolichyl-diphosphooligosaccharide--protein glycosyltransferase subunit 3B n=1 Tax=Solanum verrucosum TaxID=315347 RepID=A0AAF0UN85_SOLVR|nr:hypothetical protein MTR67_042399 [Solanum verrucosum]